MRSACTLDSVRSQADLGDKGTNFVSSTTHPAQSVPYITVSRVNSAAVLSILSLFANAPQPGPVPVLLPLRAAHTRGD